MIYLPPQCKALTGLALFFGGLEEEEDGDLVKPYLETLIVRGGGGEWLCVRGRKGCE